MRLTEIEVKGFKSFGDRVLIRFKEGVTGIVGPNGSGKSNVVDAMRWVLGEQKSRMLRSDKMDGVIFNGTKQRKQAALAEVRLTFENHKGILPSEYNEVTIGRRLYRSGESEYILNGVICRLKDITNLFLDTGIGSDSYAIIELKMIDEILNDKDHSRRDLFEEATGVSKYKIRKKETMARLESAEADLARVEDILFEIDRSMKQLQNQARKAEQVQLLKEDYRVAAGELAWHQLKGWTSQLTEGNVQEVDLSSEKARLVQALQDAEATLHSGKSKVQEAELALSLSRSKVQELSNQLRELDANQQLQEERIRSLQTRIQALEDQKLTDLGQISDQESKIDSLVNEVEAMSQHLDEASAMVADVTRRLHHDDEAMQQQERIYGEQRSMLDQLQANRYALESNVNVLEAQIKALDSEKTRLEDEKAHRLQESSQLSDLLQQLSAEKLTIQEDVQTLEVFQNDYHQKLAKCRQDLMVIRPTVAEFSRKLDRKINEAQLLGDLVQNMEGYPDSLRYLRDHQDWAKTSPLLGDIFNVEVAYKPIIERILEPYLSYYVVKSYQEARSGIRLLTDAGMGKASFFVLEAYDLEPKSQRSGIPVPEGTISAVDLVDCAAEYNALKFELLGNVFVFSRTEKDEDIAAWQSRHPGALFVTEGGHCYGDGRWMSGGSIGLFEGKKLGRQRNLESLQAQIAEDQKELDQLMIRFQELEALESDLQGKNREQELSTARKLLMNKSSEWAQVLARHEQLVDATNKSGNRNEVIIAQKEGIQLELLDLKPKLSELLGDLEQGNTTLTEMQEELASRKATYHQTREEFGESTRQELHWANLKTGAENQIDFRRNQVELLRHRLLQAEQSINALKGEMEQVKEQLKESDLHRPALLEIENMAVAEMTTAEESYYAVRGEQDALDEQIRQLHRQREVNDQLLNQRQQHAIMLQMEIKALKERWVMEFDSDPEVLELSEAPHRGEQELAGLVQTMRKKIENFGPVNPMALEAYAEVEQRHLFISGQKADLAQAREDLLRTIEEIDVKATERFMEGFSTIREHFVEVFRSLFTAEDDCDLILSHPEMPLDSPIQILAKPKGKKPQSVNQLSGGEKTLTVTALLFAIYLYKPAPFCIFDEVDAPLDDANIDKFNKMVRRFSRDSQFIIVTHNKRTMETTDIMYGVTMVEQGVSRVVPVDFSNLNEYIPSQEEHSGVYN
jgi:chromosome segregation protein